MEKRFLVFDIPDSFGYHFKTSAKTSAHAGQIAEHSGILSQNLG